MPIPADTPRIDVYDDGLALVLELRDAATEADLRAAEDLLEEWLAPYEGTTPGYRNCGVEGVRGQRTISLWADRIREDADAAVERLAGVGERACSRLGATRFRIRSAEEASASDIRARLGAPPIVIRPGGRVLAAPALGAPAVAMGVMFLAVVLARFLPLPYSGLVSGVLIAVGIPFATSRLGREIPAWLVGVAFVAVCGAVGYAVSSFLRPDLDRLTRTVALVLALVWSFAWRRARNVG